MNFCQGVGHSMSQNISLFQQPVYLIAELQTDQNFFVTFYFQYLMDFSGKAKDYNPNFD